MTQKLTQFSQSSHALWTILHHLCTTEVLMWGIIFWFCSFLNIKCISRWSASSVHIILCPNFCPKFQQMYHPPCISRAPYSTFAGCACKSTGYFSSKAEDCAKINIFKQVRIPKSQRHLKLSLNIMWVSLKHILKLKFMGMYKLCATTKFHERTVCLPAQRLLSCLHVRSLTPYIRHKEYDYRTHTKKSHTPEIRIYLLYSSSLF